MKLDDALQRWREARGAVLGRAADVVTARRALEGAQVALATAQTVLRDAEGWQARAQSHFVDTVAQLHPLLDADVAGMVGRKSVPPARVMPELADDEVTLP